MKTLKKKLMEMSAVLGLAATALTSGCKTATIQETVAGSPQILSRIRSTREYSTYSIDAIDKNQGNLSLGITKRTISETEREVYDQVPQFQVTYEVKQSPSLEGYLLFVPYYAFATVFGAAPFIDTVQVLRGEPRQTLFHGCLYLNELKADTLADTSHGRESRKEISRQFLRDEEQNKKIIKETTLLVTEPANNIEVKISTEYSVFKDRNEDIKRTNRGGTVSFHWDRKPGKMTIETLADGVNEKKTIR